MHVSTAEYYRRSIELHVNPRIGAIKLNKLTGLDLQKLYQDLRENGRLREAQKEKSSGLSASTVRGIHLMLHNALDRTVKERLIQRNPTADFCNLTVDENCHTYKEFGAMKRWTGKKNSYEIYTEYRRKYMKRFKWLQQTFFNIQVRGSALQDLDIMSECRVLSQLFSRLIT